MRRALERDGWVITDGTLRLLVVDAEKERIERWIPSTPGATPVLASHPPALRPHTGFAA